MNAGNYTEYRRAPGETTEWEDILRAKGITGPSEYEIQQAAKEQAEKMAEEAKERIDPLAFKSLQELDELEEEGNEFDDSRELEAYRLKRIAEMKALQQKNKFGEIYPMSRDEFIKEVTEASKEVWVIVFLFQDYVPDSKALAEILVPLARKHKATKFLSIKADSCIENYPDRNVPTLLLYHEGSCQHRIIGIQDFGGKTMNSNTVEWVLSRKGAVTTELEDDPRTTSSSSSSSTTNRSFTKRYGYNSDDDD